MSERAIEAALRQHWLTGIECDHAARTDTATCSCALWKSEPMPSVGAAVDAWIAHVMDRAALAAAQRVAGEDDLKAQIKQLMDDNGYTANELGKAQDEIKRLRDALALSPGKGEGWREAIEAAAKCAEQTHLIPCEAGPPGATYSSYDSRPKWLDGQDIAQAIRELPLPTHQL